MAFKAVYDAADQVPEHLRDEFKQGDDGKFRPEVEAVDGWALEDVNGLKTALQSKTAELKTALGTSKGAEAARTKLQNELDELRAGLGEGEEEVKKRIEEVKRQLNETHASELGKQSETIGTLNGQLEKTLIESAAIAAITHKDIKGNPSLLLPLVKAQARLAEGDGGEVTVEIFGSDGNGRMNGSADPMSFMDLLTEMRSDDQFAGAFEGSGHSGGDLKPTVGGSGGNGTFTAEQVESMSQREFVAAREKGQI